MIFTQEQIESARAENLGYHEAVILGRIIDFRTGDLTVPQMTELTNSLHESLCSDDPGSKPFSSKAFQLVIDVSSSVNGGEGGVDRLVGLTDFWCAGFTPKGADLAEAVTLSDLVSLSKAKEILQKP